MVGANINDDTIDSTTTWSSEKISQLQFNGDNNENSRNINMNLSDYAKKTDIPTKTSQLTNDSGFLTEHQSLEDYIKKADIPTIPIISFNDYGQLVVTIDGITRYFDEVTEKKL